MKPTRSLIPTVICLIALTHASGARGQETSVQDFDRIRLFTLANKSGTTIKVTNYGATITSIMVPDRDGKLGDVALGYNSVEGYMNAVDRPYFGAVVGRYGNRIANGSFTLDGTDYTLATNNGPNHLHGGIIGMDKVVWDAKPIQGNGWTGLELSYLAKDGEEGYPGNLQVTVSYRLSNDDTLAVDYMATTDKATPVNLTQHTYFNLSGEGSGNILSHQLMLNSEQFTPVDETLIPTGELRDVAGTPFDFRRPKAIGKEIEVENEQLKFGGGYDHNFVLRGSSDGDGMRLAAQVYDPATGRELTIRTNEPAVQFYCGNFLDGRLTGKSGKSYEYRGGFCLETPHYPDSPNQPSFPSTILKPGQTYQTRTTFAFGVRKE
ncbi:MAG: aldose epimerase family protein [Planctomycetota bacterium]